MIQIGSSALTATLHLDWVDYGFSYVNSSAAWRTPIALQLIFAIIVVFVVYGCPESPRWLVKKGRDKEAVEVLCAVFDLQEDDEYVLGEMEAIHAAINVEAHEGAGTIKALFRKDILQTRWRVFLAWFGLFMNQWSGINLVSGLHHFVYLDAFATANSKFMTE